MFSTRHNSTSIGGGSSRFAAAAASSLPRVRVFLAFAVSFSAALGCGNQGKSAVVRSYDGNFLVEAPEATTAASAASLAELTRKKVFNLLGHERHWKRAASIRLRVRNRKTPGGEMPLWSISVARNTFARLKDDVYPNRRNDVMVLQLVALCLEDIAQAVPPEKRGPPAVALPPWLSCGVAENLSRENAARLRRFVSDVVSSGNFLPIEELFSLKSLPADEAERELFFKESGSVVDFLLHQEDGDSKLRRAIMSFRAERDFVRALLLEFAEGFATLDRLQDRWKEFAVERAERTIGAPRMLLSETKASLDRVLTVTIPVIDRDTLQEKVLTTDLRGLFRHRNKRTVRRIAREKASELFQLRLRARPEYATILQEYSRALSAIGKNDRRTFKRHFSLAEGLRKKLEKTADFEVEKAEHVNTANE